MKWFFNLDGTTVRLMATWDAAGAIGVLRQEVRAGGDFYGVSYTAMRDAKAGVIEVDEKGQAELVDAEEEEEEGDES